MNRIWLLLAGCLLLGGCINASDAPDPAPEKPRGIDASPQGDAEPVPTPPSVTLSPEEFKSLTGIHRGVVENFAGRPGFGMSRIPQPSVSLEDVIAPPTPETSESAAKGRVAPKKGYGDPHSPLFVYGQNVTIQGEQWYLKSVQLVGLMVNPKPVVYTSAQLPGMRDVAKMTTRELNDFEQRGLEVLNRGEALKFEREPQQVRMMAPIYSGKGCINCHEQTGKMIGAFTYTLDRTPPSNKPAAPPAIP
jgi:hypothetical protein